ncbi:peroxiredoxin-like family protein [Flagellimonas sp. CMM7]|uniref:peroxiredoxin-like family protein n=1 Tax=Flagellimonas sp. CMM7 TaxID=2654676 RepID=UPI0013D3B048|nr:peroxiredoxin-like family protein [Flagellimonas sp. CMM7]UII79021.1 AhpC/TSA family protein [Flagellimonas sp. CMM7]
MVSLKEELGVFVQQMSENVPQEVLETMGAEIGKLAESGIMNTVLKVGDKVPGFELQDSAGTIVSLNSLAEKSDLVISFNRGNWCPFCNIELKHIQKHTSEIKSSGANLVVISPQLPEKSAEIISQNEFDYPILFDKGNEVAKQFGIAFALTESLRSIHKAFEMDIPAHNGDESFELPVPATFVVNSNNEIVFASVNPNWMERTESKEYLTELK